MAMPSRARWLLLGIALALTLVAARLVGREDEGPPTAMPATRAHGTANEVPKERLELDLVRLAARQGGAPAGDPFHTLSWESVAQEEARKSAPPLSPPPAPKAPPLPFTYMGKLIEDGRIVVFLTQGDRNLIVRLGDTIDGTYRVDAVTEQHLSLTYLPLKQKQDFAFGGAQ
jgi:hypothetical protein